MGLSESEKRVLEELERNLYENDADFARKTKAKIDQVSSRGANSPAKVVAGALLAVIGISILVFAAITQLPPVGVVGFLIMLFGLLMASASAKTRPATASSTKNPRKQQGSFFEDRWNRRTEE
ncbi:MAG: DUF3040 domain-containing protein [Rhodoluna sp.]|nr:DUF3040 domain-containing protein [Rhodoluna sp.]MBP6186434.1 DUF3040 domain-containing protein [Rhodoluna sp.]